MSKQKIRDVVQIVVVERLVLGVRALLVREDDESDARLVDRPVAEAVVSERLLRVQLAHRKLIKELLEPQELSVAAGNRRQSSSHLALAVEALDREVRDPLHVQLERVHLPLLLREAELHLLDELERLVSLFYYQTVQKPRNHQHYVALRPKAHLLHQSEHVVRHQQRLLVEPAVVHPVRPEQQLRNPAPERLLDYALQVDLVVLEPHDVPVEQHIAQEQRLLRGVQQHVVGDQPRNQLFVLHIKLRVLERVVLVPDLLDRDIAALLVVDVYYRRGPQLDLCPEVHFGAGTFQLHSVL